MLAPVVGSDVISNSMLPLVVKMASDAVPNIRFNVAKTIQTLIPLLETSVVQTRVKPCLAKLFEDSDRDVRYYAGQGLHQC